MIGRVYGPHDPLTAPWTVKVLGPGKWPKEREVPVPDVVLEQRRQINERAHRRTP